MADNHGVKPDTADTLDGPMVTDATWQARLDSLEKGLDVAIDNQRRSDCLAQIQTDAVQLTLDLLGREPDVSGFFRVFIKSLVDESESRACGVWLLDEDGEQCDLWMVYADGQLLTKGDPAWDTLPLPRESVAAHLLGHKVGWNAPITYTGDDARFPPRVRDFNKSTGVDSVIIAPMMMAGRTLGWFALSSGSSTDCYVQWRAALTDAMARQATLALHQSRLVEQSRLEARRQAVLEERNRLARDIHDTLTQGFAAILMQLQAVRRSDQALPTEVIGPIDTAIDLARSHMLEARRSVGALRPQPAGTEDVGAALTRMTELARRTTDIPIELIVSELPAFGGGVEREIIAIAQEALTNGVRHAGARKITLQAEAVRSVGFRLTIADDGRGIPKEHRGGGFGMTSMQERAERIGASLTIVTAARAGTQIVLAWEPPSFSIPTRMPQTADA